MKELTLRQELYCNEYLVDLNATQAAIRAGYSKNAAAEQGSRLLTNAKIQRRIQELNKAKLNTLGVTQKKVLEEYAKIAFFDIRQVYNLDGALKDIHSIGADEAAVISSIKTSEVFTDGIKTGDIKEIRVFDKLKALEALSKYLGLFAIDNKQQEFKTNVIVNLGSGIKPDRT